MHNFIILKFLWPIVLREGIGLPNRGSREAVMLESTQKQGNGHEIDSEKGLEILKRRKQDQRSLKEGKTAFPLSVKKSLREIARTTNVGKATLNRINKIC